MLLEYIYSLKHYIYFVAEKCGALFLTVSSVKNDALEVNWNFTCSNPPERIRLFNGDPEKQVTFRNICMKI